MATINDRPQHKQQVRWLGGGGAARLAWPGGQAVETYLQF
jgi:hypothetical protein